MISLLLPLLAAATASPTPWPIHSMDRPLPAAVAPGPAIPAPPPIDAVVLFNGRDLNAWNPTSWVIRDGAIEVTPKGGNLVSREAFGSCRLHVEWWTPPGPGLKDGQNRGNSGIFLMGLYEVQVLDTFENRTYADGMAGAVYGQHPPSVNPIRPPGQWQSYDIEFHRPKFAPDGSLLHPATVTVDFNGTRVQDDFPLTGPTAFRKNPPYATHPDKLPLVLQDHREIVRFRNIWLVPIAD